MMMNANEDAAVGCIKDTLKDCQDVNAAMSLLKNLREGAQISDTAHESLLKVFQSLSNHPQDEAAHSDKHEETEAANTKADADMAEEATDTPAGVAVPKRKSNARPFKHPSSKRQQLTSDEAAEIYSMRPEVAKGSSLRRGCMIKSKMIAPHFGVTPKTVRDIWHARTWVSATRHLWTEDEIAHRAKGVDSDEEERNGESSNSATPPPPLSPVSDSPMMNSFQHFRLPSVGQLNSNLPALSSMPSVAGMPAVPALPMQFPFTSNQVNLQALSIARSQSMSMPNLFSPSTFPNLAAPLGSINLSGAQSALGLGLLSRPANPGLMLPGFSAALQGQIKA